LIIQERPLTLQEKQHYKAYFSQGVLDKARIIDGKVPWWLRPSMQAVVLHHRIYFRPDVYQPNTIQGVSLLGHELMHVSQFLHGMTILKYLWSCRHGYMNSHYEQAAYEKGRIIAMNLQQSNINHA